MTDEAPVPLAEQPTLADAIAAVEYEIEAEIECGYEDNPYLARRLASMRFALATLQQHERAMAALRKIASGEAMQYGYRQTAQDAVDAVSASGDVG